MTHSLHLRTIAWIPSTESPVPPLDLYQFSKVKLTEELVNKDWRYKLRLIVGLYENPSIPRTKAHEFLRVIKQCKNLKRCYYKYMQSQVRQLLACRDLSEEENIAAEELALFHFR
jgi:hypothetical protein